jgi:hypothetical protein
MKPTQSITITVEQLSHLPETHRLVAELLIQKGSWVLVGESVTAKPVGEACEEL